MLFHYKIACDQAFFCYCYTLSMTFLHIMNANLNLTFPIKRPTAGEKEIEKMIIKIIRK